MRGKEKRGERRGEREREGEESRREEREGTVMGKGVEEGGASRVEGRWMDLQTHL